MIYYTVQFNDGEFICHRDTLEEAREVRSENNFKFISRSIHIYANLSSKVKGTKLFNCPIRYKVV